MRYIKSIFFASIVLLVGYVIWTPICGGRTICKLGYVPFTLSTVTFGEFSEFIPQTGTFDTLKQCLVVPIDEFYHDRLSKGLIATASYNNADYSLEVTDVNTEVNSGRFTVEMKFIDTIPRLREGQSLRLRIKLSATKEALLLPVGGFYKDTGGKWGFVVRGERAIKHDVTLGKKNTEYFEVLSGLNVGDTVITSSYGDDEYLQDEVVLVGAKGIPEGKVVGGAIVH